MTRELAKAIRECAAMNPQLSQQKIAERFRVTAGRVSESLSGKRT